MAQAMINAFNWSLKPTLSYGNIHSLVASYRSTSPKWFHGSKRVTELFNLLVIHGVRLKRCHLDSRVRIFSGEDTVLHVRLDDVDEFIAAFQKVPFSRELQLEVWAPSEYHILHFNCCHAWDDPWRPERSREEVEKHQRESVRFNVEDPALFLEDEEMSEEEEEEEEEDEMETDSDE